MYCAGILKQIKYATYMTNWNPSTCADILTVCAIAYTARCAICFEPRTALLMNQEDEIDHETNSLRSGYVDGIAYLVF